MNIIDIFGKYGLTADQVREDVIFISDRGSNVKIGLINGGFIRLTCYAHIIHNMVTYMLDDPKIKVIIEKNSKLANYVKNSGLNHKLKRSLKRFTPTRWNSVFIMLESIIESYSDVYELLIMKQRLMNEARLKKHQSTDNAISELITTLNLSDMKAMKTLPFKVRSSRK